MAQDRCDFHYYREDKVSKWKPGEFADCYAIGQCIGIAIALVVAFLAWLLK